MNEGGNAQIIPFLLDDDAGEGVETDNPARRLHIAEAMRMAEAIVFASAEPVSEKALLARLPDGVDVPAVMSALAAAYEKRGVVLVKIGDGWAFRTAGDLAFLMSRDAVQQKKLSRAALEVLAIIAYHQPVTRPEVEEIRGTSLSQQTLDSLLEANLIAPKGRRESPGRPTLWGTTPQFLAQFGLKDLRELPRREDLLLEPPPVMSDQDAQPPPEPLATDH
jgi:segregation and condensation protein B